MKKTNGIADGITVFTAWAWRILKKGAWLLGFLPQLLDYVSTYIPSQYIPAYVQALLEKGGDWRLTLILVITGLLVSAFLVHLETRQVLKELDLEIREFASEEPNVIVGFQDKTGHLVETLQIQIHPLPPKPDFDLLVEEERKQLVEEERKQLLDKRQITQSSRELMAVIAQAAFSMPNPNYEKDVEQYCPKYHSYLVRLYEHRIANDRTRSLVPIIHNKGHRPANNVTIEFAMPEAFAEPAEHQRRVLPMPEEMLEELGINTEDLAALEKHNLCNPPPRPQRSISRADSFFIKRYQPPLRFPSEIQEVSNISGPLHEVRDGVHYVIYHITQLVQHRPEDNFEPFYVWLGDIKIKHPTTWQVQVRITSADLREPQEKSLSIKMEITQDAEAG